MSYTLNRTGAQIDAIFNKVDTIFFATYGTTTYAEITTAISGGKRIFLFKGAQLYAYKGVDAVNSAYVFGQLQGTIDQPAAGFAYCTTGSSWGTEDVPLATLQQYYESLMEDEASGAIASFPDGANNVPVRKLLAHVNTTQNKHGYEYVWLAGGGKNLIPMTVASIKALNTSGSWSGNTYTVSTGLSITLNTDADGNITSISLSGTPVGVVVFKLGTIYLPAGTYTLSGCPSGGSNNGYSLRTNGTGGNQDTGSGTNPTYNEATTIQPAIVIGNDLPDMTGKVFYPMLRVSTASATFEPPSNNSPFEGFTEANIYDGSRNLICKDAFARGLLDSSTGVMAAHNYWITTDYIKVEGGQSYTLSGWVKGAEDCFCVRFCRYDANKNFIGCTSNTNVGSGNWSHAYSLVSNCAYVRITYGFNSKTTTVADFFANCDVQLEKGSIATALDTYATLYNVSWNTEAGTVYKALLNATTGELTVYEGITVFDGTENTTWNVDTNPSKCNIFYLSEAATATLLPNLADTDQPTAIAWSNLFIGSGRSALTTEPNCRVAVQPSNPKVLLFSIPKTLGISTSADFKTWLSNNNTQVVYKLKTPQTYQLTPTQVKTLLGENNIFTDTNGDVDVIYRANTGLYIKKELEA